MQGSEHGNRCDVVLEITYLMGACYTRGIPYAGPGFQVEVMPKGFDGVSEIPHSQQVGEGGLSGYLSMADFMLLKTYLSA